MCTGPGSNGCSTRHRAGERTGLPPSSVHRAAQVSNARASASEHRAEVEEERPLRHAPHVGTHDQVMAPRHPEPERRSNVERSHVRAVEPSPDTTNVQAGHGADLEVPDAEETPAKL